jgi:hypothetical protein
MLQTASALIGAMAGGGMGASVALDGEKYNRQLHQQEIAWIKKHAAAFAKANHLTPAQAQALLSLGALGMVDAEENAQIQRFIHAGTLTQEQIQKAQAYIKGHVVHEKETFDNEHHYDDTYDFKQPMFTVDAEQYFDHEYNPNQMLEGITPNTLDVAALIPPLRGVGAAVKGAKAVSKSAFDGVVNVRRTRGGDTAVRIIKDDGSVIDISPHRVKEYVPNAHPKAPPGTLNRVKFENSIPGTKGFKRHPTQEELDYLKKVESHKE